MDHTTDECPQLKEELQKMVSLGVLSFELKKGRRPQRACVMLEDLHKQPDANKRGQTYDRVPVKREKPVLIFEVNEPAPKEPVITFHLPSPFPYKSDKAVPWVYDVMVESAKKDAAEKKIVAVSGKVGNVKKEGIEEKALAANISQNQGVTRSGRTYARRTGQEEGGSSGAKDANGIPKEVDEEFLTIMKQSEYNVMDQLKKTPSRISMFSLIMSSEKHCQALQRMLNEAHVHPDITPESVINLVDAVRHASEITFAKKHCTSQFDVSVTPWPKYCLTEGPH